jgi:hypothetical protein
MHPAGGDGRSPAQVPYLHRRRPVLDRPVTQLASSLLPQAQTVASVLSARLCKDRRRRPWRRSGSVPAPAWGGRAALGLSHQWNLGAWHPFIGPKVGYISGKGVQDGGIVGPELGVRLDVARDVFLYAQAAYDHDFRNDLDEGIINGGIGAGYRF